MQAKHTEHGATSLSVMWQPNDERRMKIHCSLLFFNMVSTTHPSTMVPAEPQDNDPMRNYDPTNANNDLCIKPTAHAWKRPPRMKMVAHAPKQLPTHQNGCPHTKTVAHAPKRLPTHQNGCPRTKKVAHAPNRSPTHQIGRPHTKMVAHTQRRSPMHKNGCPRTKPVAHAWKRRPTHENSHPRTKTKAHA